MQAVYITTKQNFTLTRRICYFRVLARRNEIKARWWVKDQSIVVVLLHSYDHIK